MGTGAFSGYLLLVGFVLLFIGILVAGSSVSMLSDYSALPAASLRLLVGAIIAIAGVLLMLIGFISPRRALRDLYY